MRIGDHVRLAIDLFEADEFEASLLFACLAVDGSAGRMTPGAKNNRQRFERFLRDRYWLLEPMATPGLNLVDTRWTNVPLADEPAPDFVALVYKVLRCSLGHGDELPPGFRFTKAVGGDVSELLIGDGVLHLPDRLPFALLAAAVLAPVNAGEATADGYYFSLGDERFVVNQWWGREDDFRPIAAGYNGTRIELRDL